MSIQGRILIVEDEDRLRVNIQRFLSRRGYRVDTAADGGDALRQLDASDFDVVVTDLRLPDIDGAALIKHIHAVAPSTMILAVSAYGSLGSALSLLRSGAYDFLPKPFPLGQLEERIREVIAGGREVLGKLGARLETQHQKPGSGLLLGESSAIRALTARLAEAALDARPVLLTGENGTGKRFAGELIHRWSERDAAPLVLVDATQLSDEDAERRLAGDLDATPDAGGAYDNARRGTLIVEHLEQLPPTAQTALCRRMEADLTPAAGRSAASGGVPPRLMFTSSLEAGTLVGEERIVPALWSALRQRELRLPPLRARMEDIPVLVEYLIRKARENHRRPVFGVETAVMRRFLAYSWHGNVQELAYAIDRGVRLCEASHLRLEHLPTYLRQARTEPPPLRAGNGFRLH